MRGKHQHIKDWRLLIEFHSGKVYAVFGQLTETPIAGSETPGKGIARS